MIHTTIIFLLVFLFVLNGLDVSLLIINKSKNSLLVLGVLRMILVLLSLLFTVMDMGVYMSLSIVSYLMITIYMIGVETHGH